MSSTEIRAELAVLVITTVKFPSMFTTAAVNTSTSLVVDGTCAT